MSLYEQYFSTTNKSHMLAVITGLLTQESGRSPTQIPEFQERFHQMYPKVFETSQASTLIGLNKELVDIVGPEIMRLLGNETPETVMRPRRTSGHPRALVTNGSTPEPPPAPETPEPTERLQVFTGRSGDREETSAHRYDYFLKIPSQIKEFRLDELMIPEEPSPLFGTPEIHLRLTMQDTSYDCMMSLLDTHVVNRCTYRIYAPTYPPRIRLTEPRIRIQLLTQGHPCVPVSEDTCECRGKHIIFHNSLSYCISLKDYLGYADINPTLEVKDTLSIHVEHKEPVLTTIVERHGRYLMCQPFSKAPETEQGTVTIRNLSHQHRIRFVTEVNEITEDT
jgi:hypothetical protein